MDGIEQDVRVTGSIEVQRGPLGDGHDVDPNSPKPPHRDGAAQLPGPEPDGFADIETQIVSENLTATSAFFGVVNITGTGGGAIEELALGTGFPAISWLDSDLTLSGTPYGDLVAVAVHAEGIVNFLPAVGAKHQIKNALVEFKDQFGTTRIRLSAISCTPDGAVGGTVQLRTGADAPLEASGSSSARDYAVSVGAAIAGAALALAAGGWYARRRLLR